MKTTENISLAGYAFTIETDAYAELGTYLNDIREAFRAAHNGHNSRLGAERPQPES